MIYLCPVELILNERRVTKKFNFTIILTKINYMDLQDLGFNREFENYRKENNLESFQVGRVILEHKERYVVKTETKEYEAEIIGNLRFTARSREDFPAVGDWVAISEYDKDKVLIHAIYPRKTVIERQAVGKFGEKQIIASNIDYAFIVQAVDRDFNINRIERYLAICNNSKVKAIIILNKVDLIDHDKLTEIIKASQSRITAVPIIALSNKTKHGYLSLMEYFEKGKTYCLLGSSGVGKSTLMNNILGSDQMKTNTISQSTSKGRHVTSHRELVVLENGGILIDNPGMREVGMTDSGEGIEKTFEQIAELAVNCKYANCTHAHENGCAVIEAVKNDELDKAAYENYLKMKREESFFELSQEEKRKKDKDFGKMVKNVKKDLKKLKGNR